MLASIGWPQDGYRLFEISAFDESSVDGWFSQIEGSNALFISRILESDRWGRGALRPARRRLSQSRYAGASHGAAGQRTRHPTRRGLPFISFMAASQPIRAFVTLSKVSPSGRNNIGPSGNGHGGALSSNRTYIGIVAAIGVAASGARHRRAGSRTAPWAIVRSRFVAGDALSSPDRPRSVPPLSISPGANSAAPFSGSSGGGAHGA